MANIKSAIKRARQNTSRRKHNNARRSMMRTFVKNVLNALESGDLEAAQQAYKKAQPVIDKAVHKGLIHKNTAARQKSRLASRLQKAATAA